MILLAKDTNECHAKNEKCYKNANKVPLGPQNLKKSEDLLHVPFTKP